ncbi:MAG: vWA domain-containing protein [Candidatus Woesearchaeota archaeon]
MKRELFLILMLVLSCIPASYAKEVPSEDVLMRSLLAEEPTVLTSGGEKAVSTCVCRPNDCTAKDQYGNCIEPTCTCPPCVCPGPTCTARDQDGNCIEWEQQACNCPGQSQVDVVFVIDSTGSMDDEIRAVKDYIAQMLQFAPRTSYKLRVGVVTYRDYEKEEKEYLVRSKDLTDNIDDALKFIETIEADGGGDQPEAVADALYEAVEHDMTWDENARKAIILIGDAPPHGEGGADRSYRSGSPNGYNYRDESEKAAQKGIRIYTIICSGMDQVGTRIWKEIAEKTGGYSETLSYIRQDVDKYYAEEGLPGAYATEAKASADYDSRTNTILTNNLGGMAKAMISQAAGSPTGNSVPDEDNHAKTPRTGFFSEVWKKLTFWS